MKTFAKVGVLLISCALPLTSFAADTNKKAIKARQGEMQLRAYNAAPLFPMAKGKIEYDAAKADMLANNLVKLLDIDISSSWIKGTDNKNYPNDTTSLPKIWTTYPEISEYSKKYAKAVRELAAVAGKGKDQMRQKIGALGKSCKSCHDDFREKK